MYKYQTNEHEILTREKMRVSRDSVVKVSDGELDSWFSRS